MRSMRNINHWRITAVKAQLAKFHSLQRSVRQALRHAESTGHTDTLTEALGKIKDHYAIKIDFDKPQTFVCILFAEGPLSRARSFLSSNASTITAGMTVLQLLQGKTKRRLPTKEPTVDAMRYHSGPWWQLVANQTDYIEVIDEKYLEKPTQPVRLKVYKTSSPRTDGHGLPIPDSMFKEPATAG